MKSKKILSLSILLALVPGFGLIRAESLRRAAIAPVFLHGEGGGGYGMLEDEIAHDLERTKALDVISDELRRAGFSLVEGPCLFDGLATAAEEILFEPTDTPQGMPVAVAHPFYFDFWIPGWQIGIKYVNRAECSQIGFGNDEFIDYFRVDLIGAIQVLRERFREQTSVNAAFFFDPMPRGETAEWEAISYGFLRLQVQDFIRWARDARATGRLPDGNSGEAWMSITPARKEVMRRLAADTGAEPGSRLAAVEWLGAARDEGAIPILEKTLSDAWLRLSSAAIRSLGQIGSPKAIQVLLPKLAVPDLSGPVQSALDESDPDWPELPGAKAMLPVLEQAMGTGRDEKPPDSDFLKCCLRIDPGRTIKRQIDAFRLGRMYSWDSLDFLKHCGPENLPGVMEYLKNGRWTDSDWVFLSRELNRIDPLWRTHPAFKELLTALWDDLTPVPPTQESSWQPECCRLEECLGRLDHLDPCWRRQRAVRKLIQFLSKTLSERVTAKEWKVQEALWLAMRLKDPEADRFLASWLNQYAEDGSFLDSFCRASIFCRRTKSISPLKRMLSSDDEAVRETILQTFQYLGGREVEPSILKGLEDPSPRVRRAAAEAAGGRRLARAVPRLLRILETEHSDGGLVVEAAEALARIGTPRAVRPLVRALDAWKGDAGVACWLAKSLSTWETAEVTPALGRFLDVAAAAVSAAKPEDRTSLFLNVGNPDRGVECVLRWAVRLRRTELAEMIRPFRTCPSPRHRGLAEAALAALDADAQTK